MVSLIAFTIVTGWDEVWLCFVKTAFGVSFVLCGSLVAWKVVCGCDCLKNDV